MFSYSVLLLCSAHEYASHVNWIHCFAFQVPNCTQLVTFFVQTHAAAARPHSHEPFILLPRLTWAKVQKTSETKIGTQSIYSEITIREASIKMRETYKVLFFPFFLFVDVPAFWGGFVVLKVLRSNKREATVGI